MFLLGHVASGSTCVVWKGGQIDVTLIVDTNDVVWSGVEETEVVQLSDFDIFSIIFTAESWVIFYWICLFNVVNFNLWLNIGVHVWCIVLRRVISGDYRLNFLLVLFGFIFGCDILIRCIWLLLLFLDFFV